ncbi:hypothetical protein E143388_00132 [Rhodococcus opacus]|nr:hypothetical protein E143388_00132 [Rhodococcus opacus]
MSRPGRGCRDTASHPDQLSARILRYVAVRVMQGSGAHNTAGFPARRLWRRRRRLRGAGRRKCRHPSSRTRRWAISRHRDRATGLALLAYATPVERFGSCQVFRETVRTDSGLRRKLAEIWRRQVAISDRHVTMDTLSAAHIFQPTNTATAAISLVVTREGEADRFARAAPVVRSAHHQRSVRINQPDPPSRATPTMPSPSAGIAGASENRRPLVGERL